MIRFAAFLIVAVLAFAAPASADPAFQQWLAAQWPAAQAIGVARTTFDAATRGLEPDLSLPDLAIAGKPEKQPQQPEFVQVPSQYLREAAFVHGVERFDPAFREYFRRWAYRHPTPADFFRTMEDAAGEDLSWFWRAWFFTTAQLDQAVDSVVLADSAGVESRIVLRNPGGIAMPVELALLLDDGSTARLRLPAEVWFSGDRYEAIVPGPRKVKGVTIDPDGAYPDVRRENNRWPLTSGTP